MKVSLISRVSRYLPLVAATAAAVLIGSAHQWVTADEGEAKDRIVEITPNSDEVEVEAEDAEADAEPAYWIGVQGGPVDSQLLRTHLQLSDDLGVAVVNVVKDSPADKAGIRKHDIIIAVDGEPVSGMPVLQDAVANRGAKPLELKVIRLAKEKTIEVTPEERPADLQVQNQQFSPQDVLQGRFFQPGMVFNNRFNMNAIPGGVSVSITREGDGPAKITVKKGDKTWTVQGDDQEAIKELPDDVRPIVEQMLSGGPGLPGGAQPFVPQFQILPGQMGGFGGFQGMNEEMDAAHQRVMKQMQELEKRMDEFQRQLNREQPSRQLPKAKKPKKAAEVDPSQT